MACVSSFGIIHECSACGQTQQAGEPFKLQIHYLWANGKGAEVRHFCSNCGQVETIKNVYGRAVQRRVEKWKASVS